MQMAGILTRHRYLTQVFAVIVITAAFAILTDAVNFRSLANLVWMVGAPAIIAVCSNRGWDRRAFMIMALAGISWITAMIIGVNFTSYS